MKRMNPGELDALLEPIPDVRDGLTRTEWIVLYALDETQRERTGRNVPTVMLYGRVLEYVNFSEGVMAINNRNPRESGNQ